MKILLKTLLILFAVMPFATVQCKYYLAMKSSYQTKIWEMKKGNWKDMGINIGLSFSIAFSPQIKGKYYFASTKEKSEKIKIWNIADLIKKKSPREIKTEGEPIEITFSPDGKFLASLENIGYNIKIEIFRFTKDGNWVKDEKFKQDYYFGPMSIAFSSDGKYFVSGSFNGNIQIWNTNDWSKNRKLEHDGAVEVIGFSPQIKGKYYLASAGGKEVKIWNPTDNWKVVKTKSLSRVILKPKKVLSLAFSPDGKYFAYGLNDANIEICDTKTWEKFKKVLKNRLSVDSLAFSPKDKSGKYYLVSGTREVRIWDPKKNWKNIKNLKQNKFYGHSQITSLAFSQEIKKYGLREKDVEERIGYVVEEMIKEKE